MGVVTSNLGVMTGIPPKLALAGVWAVSARDREDFTVEQAPNPRAAEVKVDEARGVSSPNREDVNLLRVDLRREVEVGPSARIELFFLVVRRLVLTGLAVKETRFELRFTVDDTSFETEDEMDAATLASSVVKSAPSLASFS